MALWIKTNIAELAKEVAADARDQVPFAMALALTRTAKDVQRRLVDTLDEYFTLRGQWVPRSIRIDKATKHDLTARVGSLYEPMVLQAEGGEKVARSGDLAVPVAARAQEGDRTAPGRWPGKLLQRPNFFLRESAAGPAIFERVDDEGRGRKRGRRLKLWWLLEPAVKVEQRWPFEDLAEETVEAEVRDNFFAALEQALRTRR